MVSNEIKPNQTELNHKLLSMPGLSSTLIRFKKEVQRNVRFQFGCLFVVSVAGLLITSPHNCVAHTKHPPRGGEGEDGEELTLL